MMTKRDNIQKLITRYTRRLHKLKEQNASFGINVPPQILTEIEDVEAEIVRLQAELDELTFVELQAEKAQEYLHSIIRKYKTYESYYTDLAASVTPHVPMDFVAEQSAVQVLIERCFGEDYVTVDRIRVPRLQDVIKDYPRIVLLGEPGGGKR
jgi:hypothetical protein